MGSSSGPAACHQQGCIAPARMHGTNRVKPRLSAPGKDHTGELWSCPYGRDLWRSPTPPPLQQVSYSSCTEQHPGRCEQLQERRVFPPPLPGSAPGLCHPHSLEVLLYIQMELSGFQFVPIAPRPVAGYQMQPYSIFLMPFRY